MRDRAAGASDRAASSMSLFVVRASAAMTGRRTASAIWRTASASAGDAIGNPASMMSTPSRSSACAMATFDGTSIEKPGACSPSRRVVSKTTTRAGLVMDLVVGLSR